MYTLIIVFFLISIVVSFLCSILEAVLLSISPAFAEQQRVEAPLIGKALVGFRKNIDRPLAAILTLNTIAHTVGAIGVGAQALVIWGDSYIAAIVVPVVMTLAILILSEIIPKTIGALYWRELTPFTVRTLKIILIGVGPLVILSQAITRIFTKGETKSILSRADFTAMANLGEKQGVLDEQESSLLKNFMRFRSVTAHDIMTPRTVIINSHEDVTLADFHEQYPDLRFSRIPLYRESIDHITGYILRDDLLAGLIEGNGDNPLSSISRTMSSIAEDFPLQELFTYFTTERTHIAMVLDSFGGVAGLVTMEDVIETLIGLEIVDELDESVDMQVLARRQWEKRAKRVGLIQSESEAGEV